MNYFQEFCRKLPNDIKNKTSHSIEHLLSNNIQDCLSVAGIAVRKAISPALRKAYRKHIRYSLVADSAVPLPQSNKGRIFAATHRQKDDIIISMCVADCSAYTVFGGTEIALDTLNGLGLWAYGIILVNRNDKISRQSAYNKMKYVIEHGGNIIIYPEGYFNIADDGEMDDVHGADGHNSDSWLVQELNLGAFRLAQETGCEIVPMVLHYDETDGKVCYTHRGTPFTVAETDDIISKKDQLLAYMQTEYYKLIEKYSAYSRNQLEENGTSLKHQHQQWTSHQLKRVEISHTGYKMDMASEKQIGKAKTKKHVVTYKEAFAHIKDIVPSAKNAFIFRNKN